MSSRANPDSLAVSLAPESTLIATSESRFPRLHPLVALAQAGVILLVMYVYLHGWNRDFHVPLGFSIDSLFYLMQAKSTADNGWWWFNPMVGAPLGLNELAFPANGNLDQVFVWLTSRLIRAPLGAINAAWLLMVAVSGIVATWCLRTLAVSLPAALVAGTLFALSPYALYKNLGHFGMAVYLIPFICTVAMQLASGRLPEHGYRRGAGLALLVGSGLLGFNYVYYPFFGCFFLLVATAAGYVTYRERRILTAGILTMVVVGGCTFLNLAPSLYVWNRYGKPIIISDKVPAQGEVYALKIRTLVSPTFEHWFPPFQHWIRKEAMAQFPLETENMTSRLGSVGTLGFVGLLGLLLAPALAQRSTFGRLCLAGSQLTVAGLLLATIGGFGSLFNLLVVPEIRAYARICPFLEVFALTAVAGALHSMSHKRVTGITTCIVVLAVGLLDQAGGAAGMNVDYPALAVELPALTGFVRQLEHRLPNRAMVLQLPFRRTYLNESGVWRMQPYEHLKMYLVSRRLRWSYPALSNDQVGWQEAAASLPAAQLIQQAASEGFVAVVIDRYGYEDSGQAVQAALGLSRQVPLADTERFIAFDIRPFARPDITPLPLRPGPLSPGLPVCPAQTTMSVDRIGTMRIPFLTGEVAVPRSRPLKISGWSVDLSAKSAGAGVDIVVDGALFPSFYGLDRQDVSNLFGSQAYGQSGYAAELPPNTLSPGTHTLTIREVSANRQCYYQGAPFALMAK